MLFHFSFPRLRKEMLECVLSKSSYIYNQNFQRQFLHDWSTTLFFGCKVKALIHFLPATPIYVCYQFSKAVREEKREKKRVEKKNRNKVKLKSSLIHPLLLFPILSFHLMHGLDISIFLVIKPRSRAKTRDQTNDRGVKKWLSTSCHDPKATLSPCPKKKQTGISQIRRGLMKFKQFVPLEKRNRCRKSFEPDPAPQESIVNEWMNEWIDWSCMNVWPVIIFAIRGYPTLWML